MSSNVHGQLMETCTYPRTKTERHAEQEVSNIIKTSPSTSVQRISSVNVSQMKLWKTLNNFGLNPHHIQPFLIFQPGDYTARVNLSSDFYISLDHRYCNIRKYLQIIGIYSKAPICQAAPISSIEEDTNHIIF